ncbi:MAG TPA: ATP synthase F0 subunit C [Vicinamibacterales bacterium]|jgi:F-type H+-transporting ATPase subunit c
MNSTGFFRKATVTTVVAIAVFVVFSPTVWAQEAGAAAGSALSLNVLGVALGMGMIVIGAGLGIGKLAAAAAEGIARQPSAAAQITGAVNLPLFLLEGVAILGEILALASLFF